MRMAIEVDKEKLTNMTEVNEDEVNRDYAHAHKNLNFSSELIRKELSDPNMIEARERREFAQIAGKFEDQEKFYDFLRSIASPMEKYIPKKEDEEESK